VAGKRGQRVEMSTPSCPNDGAPMEWSPDGWLCSTCGYVWTFTPISVSSGT
jgi:hypothetical protein